MSNLQQRLIVGIISILLAFMVIWSAPYPYFRVLFSISIAAVVATATYEFLRIAENKKYRPLVKTGTAASFFYIMACYLSVDNSWAEILPYLVLFLALIGSFLYFLKEGEEPIANISITLFSLLYLAIPLSSWIGITFLFPHEGAQEGRFWIFYLLAVTKFTDMGAYFVGSAIGKNKLSPFISPGKSWEGAIGGLIIGTLTSVVFYLFSNRIPLQITLFQSLCLGVILSIMGQLGDLAESLFKRDAGVKDSNTIPGLGGFLDMVDSLVFTSPIVYIFLMINSN